MQQYELLLTLGSCLAGLAVFINLFLTRKKIAARAHLLQHLKDDLSFLSETERLDILQRQDLEEVKKEMAKLRSLIEQQLDDLDPEDRKRIESSLYQNSRIGRIRYLQSLVKDARKLHREDREVAHAR